MTHYRSKTLATWIAVLRGCAGPAPLARKHATLGLAARAPPALAGLYGVQRMNELGQDDKLAWR